jgi:D-alanine-D-alanine ligase
VFPQEHKGLLFFTNLPDRCIIADMTDKKRVAIMFGGKSAEHEVSVITGLQIVKNIDRNEFDVLTVYVSKEGEYYIGEALEQIETYKDLSSIPQKARKVQISAKGEKKGFISVQPASFAFRKKEIIEKVDVIFPCFHGGLGENGGFQALFEIADIPYVGSGIVASATGMDKVIMKDIFTANDIPITKYMWFYRNDWDNKQKDLLKDLEKSLTYPFFVKPANAGSSIGISKAHNQKELIHAIEVAMLFDRKIIVEESFEKAREINVSVIGNSGDELMTSECEEVFSSQEVLTYEEKYGGENTKSSGMASAKRKLPADLTKDAAEEIRSIAKKVFASLDCSGLARIDFLFNEKTNTIKVIEINTIPGSMSFYLWEASGLPFPQMITKLISLAFERYEDGKKSTTTFASNILANFQTSMKAPKR